MPNDFAASRPDVSYVFLDSGIGGLPYLRQLKTLSPVSRCVYVADTARFPYGEKSPQEIAASAVEVTGRIVERFHPTVIVIACNTISVSALDILRKTFPISFVGTVPAVKKAAEISRNRKIGLLATERTVGNSYTQRLIDDFAPDCEIIRVAASPLIADIEDRLVTASEEEKEKAVKPFLVPFLEGGADTVVLACTHFLHITEVFRRVLGPSVTVVDSLDGVAHQALAVFLRCTEAARNGLSAQDRQDRQSEQSERSDQDARDARGEIHAQAENPSLPKSPAGRLDAVLFAEAGAGDFLFVTGNLSAARIARYELYCGLYGLSWGGIL